MAHILNKETGKANFVADTQPKVQTVQDNSAAAAKPANNNFDADNIPVRDAMNAFGFDNDKIGYNGTDVTYDGQAVINPTENVNGVTKTTTKGLVDGANEAYKKTGSDDYIVDVTQYAASSTLLPNIVNYHDNGSVTLGSVPIENVVVINGNSLAPRSAVEAAVKKFKEQTGYTTATEKANQYLSRSQDIADSYVNRINNYGPFAYDPESDPAYQAYKNAYMRNAKRAQEDTLAANNARTGGYSNSAAISAGNQAYYNHLDALNDRIPQLMDNAYTRYRNEYDMLLKGLEMYGTPMDRYKIAADSNNVDIEAMMKALDADYNRDIDNRDFNYKVSKDNLQFEHDAWYDQWELENILMPKAEMLKFENENKERNQNLDYAISQANLESKQLNNKATRKKYGY